MTPLLKRTLVAAALISAVSIPAYGLFSNGPDVSYIVKELTRRANTPYLIDLREKYPDGFSFSAIGDSGTGKKDQRKVAREMFEYSPGFILHMGDVVYNTGRAERYPKRFIEPYGDFISGSTPFYPVPGNHDYLSEYGRAFFDYFDHLPNRYYHIETGLVDFFALDTNSLIEEGADPEQISWLADALKASDKEFQVVYMHHPVFSSGWHGDNDVLIGSLKGLFEKGGVDLVLSGHEHDYERLGPVGGVLYVVSGGGGADLRDRMVESHILSKLYLKKHHFLYVEATPGSLKVRVIGKKGKELDSFEIKAEGGDGKTQ